MAKRSADNDVPNSSSAASAAKKPRPASSRNKIRDKSPSKKGERATRSVSRRSKSTGHGAAPSSNGGSTESRSSGAGRSRRGAASWSSILKSAAGVRLGDDGLDAAAAAAAAADVDNGDLKKPAAGVRLGGDGLDAAAAAAAAADIGNGDVKKPAAAAGISTGGDGLDAAAAAAAAAAADIGNGDVKKPAAAAGIGAGGDRLDPAAAAGAGGGTSSQGLDAEAAATAATGGGTGGQGHGAAAGGGAGGVAVGQGLKKPAADEAAAAAAGGQGQGKGLEQSTYHLDDTASVEDQGERYSSGLFSGNIPPSQTHGPPLRHNDNNPSSFGSDDEDDSTLGDLHRDDIAGTKLQKFLKENALEDLSLIPSNHASKHQDDYDETYLMCYINDGTKYNGDAAVIIQKTNNNKGTKIKKDMPYFVMMKFVCVVSNESFVIIYPSHAAFQRAFYSFILNGGSVAGSMVIIKEPRSHDKHLQGDDCLIIESDEPVLLLPPDLKIAVLNSINEYGNYIISEDNHTKSFLFHHASLYCIAPHARESSCNNNFCDRKNLKTEKSHCPCPSSSRSSGMVLQCGIKGVTVDGQEFRDEFFVSWDLTKLLIANVADSSRSWEDYETHRSELKRKINEFFQYVNTHGGFSAGLWQKRGNVTVVNNKETTVVLSNEVHPHLVFIRPTNPIDPSVLRSLQYSLPTPSVSALLNAQMD